VEWGQTKKQTTAADAKDRKQSVKRSLDFGGGGMKKKKKKKKKKKHF
jgi:hypothetical protein